MIQIKHENKIRFFLEQKGFKVFRNGWPDFLVIDKDKETVFGIEVKRSFRDHLKEHQKIMHKALSRYIGIDVYMVTSEDDIRSILLNKLRKVLTVRNIKCMLKTIKSTNNINELKLELISFLEKFV